MCIQACLGIFGKGKIVMARILIVEDESLISLMLEDWLTELGHQPLGPAQFLTEALKMARELDIDAAILDIHLRSESSDAVADIFIDRKIPFAISSGSAAEEIETRFAGRPNIAKPYDFDTFKAVIDQLAGC